MLSWKDLYHGGNSMRHTRLRPQALLLIALSLGGSAVARAQCMSPIFHADLKTGIVFNSAPAVFDVISPMAPSSLANCKGWQEMVVKINIPDFCTAAIVDTDYEGAPQAWTLNIGDSPTNNGFSGDAGTTVHNAELWVLDDTLSLANAGNSPSVIDSPLVFNRVALTDGAMKFLIRDQYVSWGNPFQFVQSPNNKLLFAIPDPTMADDSRSIYAGFNRVIDGAPGNGRTGCGLRRVTIRFE
jgi:hypothetical protein